MYSNYTHIIMLKKLGILNNFECQENNDDSHDSNFSQGEGSENEDEANEELLMVARQRVEKILKDRAQIR